MIENQNPKSAWFTFSDASAKEHIWLLLSVNNRRASAVLPVHILLILMTYLILELQW